ncbi:hypothetical protein [Collimonas silvisoli]|uniref:hypothetical protein n=1 Tax=Collimonas silvisoli TaxID=2825884 RepID=UPI001B8D2D60|nr:hypothetical protein [Collimonas silvisoli]
MKTTSLITALSLLPILSACASSASTDVDNASSLEKKEYYTGSMLPKHVQKNSDDQSTSGMSQMPTQLGTGWQATTIAKAGGK